MAFIESGREDGATLECGGNRVGEEGYFIEPTVFTDVRPDMKIVKEEIFGPGTKNTLAGRGHCAELSIFSLIQ